MATYSVRNVGSFSVRKKVVLETFGKSGWISEHRGLATIVKHQTTVDENTKEQLEQNVMKHKTHHGIVQPKTVILPGRLEYSTKKYLQDRPVKQLQPHAKAMANYLWSRKRPVEEANMRKRAKEFAEQFGVAGIDEDLISNEDLPKESKVKISAVMKKLKKELYNWKPIKYDEVKGNTYLLARLAPNYAITFRVLHEIKKRVPDFNPQAVLDFGSGLGSTVWATHQLWRTNVLQYYCVDTSRDMHSIAENILCGGNKEENEPYLNTVFFRHFLPVGSRVTFDLVISAHALLELPSKQERLKTIETLWRKTDQFMVLIENETFEGYMALMEVRDFVLKECEAHDKSKADGKELPVETPRLGQNTQVGHVFAPCQHDLTCPKLGDTNIPCNFEQKYQPLPLSGKDPEPVTERFSYLVLRKGERQSENVHWPRIVKPVILRSKHVVCNLCCANGKLELATITKTKHGMDLYRCARNSRWGDLLPISKPSDEGSILEQEQDGNQWIASEQNEARNSLHSETHSTQIEETLSNSGMDASDEMLTDNK